MRVDETAKTPDEMQEEGREFFRSLRAQKGWEAKEGGITLKVGNISMVKGEAILDKERVLIGNIIKVTQDDQSFTLTVDGKILVNDRDLLEEDPKAYESLLAFITQSTESIHTSIGDILKGVLK